MVADLLRRYPILKSCPNLILFIAGYTRRRKAKEGILRPCNILSTPSIALWTTTHQSQWQCGSCVHTYQAIELPDGQKDVILKVGGMFGAYNEEVKLWR